MNSRTLALLATALLALVAVAFWQSQTGPSGTVAAGGLLLPGLRDELNDIDLVRITASGNRTIATIRRSDDGWAVEERADYPADVGRLRKNLLALAEAEILEKKTANPEFFERLGVGDVESEASRGMRFDIVAAAGSEFSVIVGDTGVSGGDNAYVRRAGEDQSWLVKGDFDPGTDTVDWLDSEIVDLPSSDVRRVSIAHPDGERLVIEKTAADEFNFQVLDIPDGRELSYSTVANSIGSALAALSFESVSAADQTTLGGIEPVVVQFESADGLSAKVSVYELESGRQVGFEFSQTTVKDVQAQAESEEDSEPTSAQDDSDEPASADELNARVQGWLYELPSYKSDQLVKRMADLLKSESDSDP